jgi:hypothetical protein
MDIKHSDPKLSVEEAWLTMTMCITMIIYISIDRNKTELNLHFRGVRVMVVFNATSGIRYHHSLGFIFINLRATSQCISLL